MSATERAVAGDRHDVAAPLQRRDDVQLLDWLDSGEDPGAGNQAVELRLFRARRSQFGADDHLLLGLGNS